MQEWLDFLNNNLPEAEARSILPIERDRPLDFEWVPKNSIEFEQVINNASVEILEGLGFIRYSSLPEDPYRQCQTEINILLGEEFELLLIPVGWYGLIPDGYLLIDIFAESFCFTPGKNSSDARLGCLGYGISVQINK